MHYYEPLPVCDSRWHLEMKEHFADGTPTARWAYFGCEPVPDPKPVPFSIAVVGRPVDFNPTTFGALVLSKLAADLVSRLADDHIQRIPAEIDAINDWEVVKVLAMNDCIDLRRSMIQYYPPDDESHPDEPRGVLKLVLDQARIPPNAHIFKPRGWLVTTIVSEALKNAFEEHEISGVEFNRVTGW